MSDENFYYEPKPARGRKARSSTPPVTRQGTDGRAVDYAPRPARDTRGQRPPASRKASGRTASRGGSGGIRKLMRNKTFWQIAAVGGLLLIVVVPVIAELLQSRAPVASSDPISLGNDYYDQALNMVQQGNSTGAVSIFEKAASAYERALLQDPQNTEVRTDLGAVYYYQGMILGDSAMMEKAVAAWEKVLEYDPNKTEALFNLGLGYSGLGQDDAALAVWQRVIEIDPTSESAQQAQQMIQEYTATPTSLPAGP